MDWNSMSNTAIIDEIGLRIKAYRLKMRYTQRELAKLAGVSVFTIAKIETGLPVSISMLIPVLRVFGLLDNLGMLFPEIELSPVVLMKLKRKTPKKIRTSKKTDK
jgi:DNA-binding XRE family transcriptional regulator